MALAAGWLIFVYVTDGIGCQGHGGAMALALTAGGRWPWLLIG